MRWAILILAVLIAMPSIANAQMRTRSPLYDLSSQRREMLRLSKELDQLQRELFKELMSSEIITAAQSDYKVATAEMKTAREIVNEQMLADSELQQMKLELFRMQAQVTEARNSSSSIDTRTLAQQMLDLRTKIRVVEVGIQESVDAFVDARDRLQLAQQDLNDARRDVMDQLKNDPTLAAARERIKSARAAMTSARRR